MDQNINISENTIQNAPNCTDPKCWHDMFQKIFENDAENTLQYLKLCGCFSENNWRENVKHALHRRLNSSCETYSNAQELIRMTYFTQQERMLLSDLILTHIPTNIGTLINLKNLTLDELDIHSLPKDMGNLINLKTINITKCPIYEIPEWFSNFKNLHTLNFSRCRIRTIPESMSQCSNLDTLCLGYNMISEIPNSVLEMQSIERIVLDCNPVSIVWTDSMLKGCLLLSIMQTNITDIPEHVIHHLYQLVWNGCNVSTLPLEMGTTLTHLNLAENNLTKLPESLSKLTSLTYLNISNNHFSKMPLVIEQMKWIKHLMVQNNPFSK